MIQQPVGEKASKVERMERALVASIFASGKQRAAIRAALVRAAKGGEEKTKSELKVEFAQCPVCPAAKSSAHQEDVHNWAETHRLLHLHRDHLRI